MEFSFRMPIKRNNRRDKNNNIKQSGKVSLSKVLGNKDKEFGSYFCSNIFFKKKNTFYLPWVGHKSYNQENLEPFSSHVLEEKIDVAFRSVCHIFHLTIALNLIF